MRPDEYLGVRATFRNRLGGDGLADTLEQQTEVIRCFLTRTPGAGFPVSQKTSEGSHANRESHPLQQKALTSS
jgi:hypothetical protein